MADPCEMMIERYDRIAFSKEGDSSMADILWIGDGYLLTQAIKFSSIEKRRNDNRRAKQFNQAGSKGGVQRVWWVMSARVVIQLRERIERNY